MIQDTSLFASNSPIGRLWYFINIIILCFLGVGARIGIIDYILPNANPSFKIPVIVILCFVYIILLITFFMLIDRRIYDISGSRYTNTYNILSKVTGMFLFLFFVFFILTIISLVKGSKFLPVHEFALVVTTGIFYLFVVVIGFIKGKSTNKI